jgi:hypothetical protein
MTSQDYLSRREYVVGVHPHVRGTERRIRATS